jgi:putative heme-binding domain-containing protein
LFVSSVFTNRVLAANAALSLAIPFSLGVALGVSMGVVSYAQDKVPPKIYTQGIEVASAQDAAAGDSKSSLRSKALQEGPRASWVWGDNPNARYVISKKFKNEGAVAAWIAASCDNEMVVSLNGKSLGRSDSWEEGLSLDVSKGLVAGENEVSFEVWNHGGVAALVAKLAMVDSKGGVKTLETDASWSVSPKDKPAEGKPVKIIAKYGDSPWGDVLNKEGGEKSNFAVVPGFAVERLFRVPKEELGSWVCLTADPKGRLIASDQGDKGLYRITPPTPGSNEETRVERLDVNISSAQGLLFAFDSLYVSVNGGIGSGLYRLRDTNGDDQFDEVKKLKEFRGGGEHGPHALRLAPDGKSIYVCCGNHTLPPADRKTSTPPQTMGGPRAEQLRSTLPEGMTSRIAPVWDEDLLLPRQWDANGHAAGILAPGGWIAKTDPDGKDWEMVTIGYRNQYDFDFDTNGEMFVYDADMEWDMGTPWYRPTRVVHATSGSEFGWRSGTGKWPTYYLDSLPQLVDIGPGSPVGVEFGTGTKFPAKYQKALYICDWTFGTMYAIHMEPAGASFKATKEEFLSRTPLPLTDVTVGKDGHLYFTVGGRGTQSELYRVIYKGAESTARVAPSKLTAEAELRRSIEQFHQADSKEAAQKVDILISQLKSPDRHIRYAARVALERLPTSAWVSKVLDSSDAETLITGGAAIARVGDSSLRDPLLERLGSINFATLSAEQRLEIARTVQLVLIRLGAIDDTIRRGLLERIEPLFPSQDASLNRELVILLTFLDSQSIAGKVLPMLAKERVMNEADFTEILQRNRGYGASIAAMLANQPDLQQFHYAFSMRNLKSGWTVDQRKEFFAWFQKAQSWQGGNSYQKFLINAANDAYALCNDQERFVLEALGVRKPAEIPKTLPQPKGPGKAYTTEELASLAADKLKGRNFDNGKKMYAAARCVVCHRFGGEGGATGPDLTQVAGRFSPADLIDSIVRPSQVISDQYKTMVIKTSDDTVHTGRIVNDVAGKVTLVVDPEDATKTVTLDRSDIEEEKVSKVSLMPAELLDKLNQDEVLDLLAFVLSRGNANTPMFK